MALAVATFDGAVWHGPYGEIGGIDAFISGLDGTSVRATQPTIPTWDNTGHTGTLVPYVAGVHGPTPDGAGVINFTTDGVSLSGIDFGNYTIKTSCDDFLLTDCRVRLTDIPSDGSSTAAVDFRPAGTNRKLLRCTIENLAQNIRGMSGVMGHDFTLERCRIRDFIDDLNTYTNTTPNTGSSDPINILVLDTYLGEVAWTWHSSGGVVHSTDYVSHSDVWQTQGGKGLRCINVTMMAHVSERIGTGTPNSGSDAGWPTMPYTQAQGVTHRYDEIKSSDTTPGAYSNPAVRGYNLGGSTLGLMVNTSLARGYEVEAELAWVYASGGTNFINSPATTTGSWGTITHLRAIDNQRNTSSGVGIVVAIVTGTPVTMTDAFYATDTTDWASTGTVITRRNT